MDNIPPHILSYAKSDANSIIQSVNQFGNFNAELTQFNVILEDGVDPIYPIFGRIPPLLSEAKVVDECRLFLLKLFTISKIYAIIDT